jgi:hypothetical protein
MKAKSIKGKSTEEIQSALQHCMTDARPDDTVGRGFKPTLAVVFLSISQDRNAICKLLHNYGIAVFGVTTKGEFIDEE